jgi:outer membrane murein-binding lipoprotein Lpp
MTCRGYDPKAVKISKSVKRLAAKIHDNHQRGEFIRSYVRVAQEQARGARKEK